LPKDKTYFILFATIHDVLKAEKLLKKHDLTIEVVPVPRSLSSDCGVCIKSSMPWEGLEGFIGPMPGITSFAFDGKDYTPDQQHSS
jgi:hypothetical protein